MLKKAMAAAAVAVSVAGITAPTATAIGDDSGTQSMSGNGAKQSFGNSGTKGDMSPQLSLVQGALNKPCVAIPIDANIGSLVGLVNVAVQDIPILSAEQKQICAQNSTQAKGDEPLSHILSDIPLLSGNGTNNG
ncbi:rodlin [Streptomyces sp. NPDC017941]|uniref:rodlin n=1 Tax=unclassified Streptomyces TaxID=2593676 RepID=UPI0037BA9486